MGLRGIPCLSHISFTDTIITRRLFFFHYIATLDELVRHGLHALRDTLQQDKEIDTQNCTVGVVGEDQKFETIEGDRLQRYLDLLDGGDTGQGGETVESMDTE